MKDELAPYNPPPPSGFDRETRERIIGSILEGCGTWRECTRLAGASVQTAAKWMSEGRKPGSREDRRLFYLKVRSAEEQARAKARVALARHAEDGEDWRAAEAFLKRVDADRDREELAPLREARIREAKAQARLAEARAETAERALRVINGRLVLPTELSRMLTEQERAQFSPLLERLGILPVTESEVAEEMVASIDTEELDQIEALWRDEDEPESNDLPDP